MGLFPNYAPRNTALMFAHGSWNIVTSDQVINMIRTPCISRIPETKPFICFKKITYTEEEENGLKGEYHFFFKILHLTFKKISFLQLSKEVNLKNYQNLLA